MKLIRYLIILILFLPISVFPDEPASDAEKQIDHLLTFIATSPCKFMRNGKWYESSDEADHIKKKYKYVLGKGLVKSPEDFVKYSATKSSMSGKNYNPSSTTDLRKSYKIRYLQEIGLFFHHYILFFSGILIFTLFNG